MTTIEVLFDGNDRMAHGYSILRNLDNLDATLKSIMINEDLIDVNRLNATSPYNITHNAQILKMDLVILTKIIPIAYVNEI